MGNDLELIASLALRARSLKDPVARLKVLKQIELLLKSAKADALIEQKRSNGKK